MSKFVDTIKKSDLKPGSTAANTANLVEVSLEEYLAEMGFTSSDPVPPVKAPPVEPFVPLDDL